MTKVHVNTSLDRSSGYSAHFYGPAPYIPWTIIPSIEGNCIMEHYGGAAEGAGTHKLTSTVYHKNLHIVLAKHDCGPHILDHTIPPFPINLYEPAIWSHTVRQIAFASSKVKMNGTPTGCAEDGADTFPLMTCGTPMRMPLAFPRTNGANTVCVGMTKADIFFGWLEIVLTMIFELALFILTLPLKMSGELLEEALKFFWRLVAGDTDVGAILADLATKIARWIAEGRQEPFVYELPDVIPTLPDDLGNYLGKDRPRRIVEYDPQTGSFHYHEEPRPPGKGRTPVPRAPRHIPAPAPAAPPVGPPAAPPPAPPAAAPEQGTWGHSLVPPDDQPGWQFEPEEGWILSP